MPSTKSNLDLAITKKEFKNNPRQRVKTNNTHNNNRYFREVGLLILRGIIVPLLLSNCLLALCFQDLLCLDSSIVLIGKKGYRKVLRLLIRMKKKSKSSSYKKIEVLLSVSDFKSFWRSLLGSISLKEMIMNMKGTILIEIDILKLYYFSCMLINRTLLILNN